MRVLTKRLRLESRGFCNKVALYLSYLHIKSDDETKEIPSNVKYTFRFACVQSYTDIGLALFAARFRSYWDL